MVRLRGRCPQAGRDRIAPTCAHGASEDDHLFVAGRARRGDKVKAPNGEVLMTATNECDELVDSHYLKECRVRADT